MIAVLILTLGILVTPAAAFAEPAQIEDASGTGPSGAASIQDGPGTPGPSFDEPISIPSVGAAPKAPKKPGKGATPEEKKAYAEAMEKYADAKAEHNRQVQAREAAKSLEETRKKDKAYRGVPGPR